MEEEQREINIQQIAMMRRIAEALESLNETFKLTNEQQQGYY